MKQKQKKSVFWEKLNVKRILYFAFNVEMSINVLNVKTCQIRILKLPSKVKIRKCFKVEIFL